MNTQNRTMTRNELFEIKLIRVKNGKEYSFKHTLLGAQAILAVICGKKIEDIIPTHSIESFDNTVSETKNVTHYDMYSEMLESARIKIVRIAQEIMTKLE